MSRKFIPSAILTVALVGLAAYFHGGGQAPPGQAPLESLTTGNLSDIKNAFNAAQDNVRVLLLLSPT